MEIRSLFSKIFGTKKNVSIGTELQLLNGFQATFTNYNGKLYDSPSVRACIDAIARNGAKLNPKHIRINNGKLEEPKNYNLERLINEQPNELMNAYDFYYKIISELCLNNNAFVYILRDEKGSPIGLYPLRASQYSLLEYGGNIYVRFNFTNGQYYTASLKDDVIHLKRFFCENDVLGGNTTPIVEAMSFKHIMQEGLKNAIKTTSGIKGVLKTNKAMLKPEDVKKVRDQFVKDFVNGENGSGIAGLDATTEFKEVNINPKTAEDAQIREINDEIKNYFGVSEEILQSKFSEDQWNAFYESTIEPIGLMMGLEFTNKIFSLSERNHGNKIIFESNRLQYASNNTKITVIKEAGALGLLTINESREILNLPPVEDGDQRVQSLNYIDKNNDDRGGSNE